jgi:hypothetical protein
MGSARTTAVTQGRFIPTTGHETMDWAPWRTRRTKSADLVSLAGPIGESTQIYEGTNQIQRVVMAKKAAWIENSRRKEPSVASTAVET